MVTVFFKLLSLFTPLNFKPYGRIDMCMPLLLLLLLLLLKLSSLFWSSELSCFCILCDFYQNFAVICRLLTNKITVIMLMIMMKVVIIRDCLGDSSTRRKCMQVITLSCWCLQFATALIMHVTNCSCATTSCRDKLALPVSVTIRLRYMMCILYIYVFTASLVWHSFS